MNLKKIFLLIIFISTSIVAQQRYTISGIVTDASSGETLYGASVFIENTTIGVLTNEYGFYSISAPKGTCTLVVSYLGYANVVQQFDLNTDKKLAIELKENSTQLNEVLITSSDSEEMSISKPQMSVLKLSAATLKQVSSVMGEVDILKTILLLPGVTNNGEGSTGFNVRGGAVDQNLVLLDEAIIYNTSHVFGFFSVFNSDAIKDLKLYKGGIPARFGGRVSSVLDVRQKDGNSKQFKMSGGIGTISSRLAIEAPLFNGQGSFIVAGRASYVNLFLDAFNKDYGVGFYDLNLKGNYSLNDNNKLFLSGYFGRDNMVFSDSFNNSYGNLSGNLRWNHIFNDKLFSNLSLIYSKYDYELGIDIFEFDWISSIENFNVKYDFRYYINDAVKLNFGASSISYNFNPGEIFPTSGTSSVNYFKLDQKRAFESGVYASVEQKISQNFSVEYGLRWSYFNRQGGQSVANYVNGMPVVYNEKLGIYETGEIESETDYAKDESIANYNNFEPRLAVAYELNNSSSVKAGYSRTAQYLHLLSNTTNVTPLDVWTPSGKFIKPQLSNQYSVGYYKNFKGELFSLEVEAYYKDVANRIDYIDGADLIGNNYIEGEILNGQSRAYGLEFLLRKTVGKFTGWFAYTLSKTEQKTLGGKAGGLGINDGNWYNSSYDRVHDLSITGSFNLNEKWSFGTNFVFQTGRPVTYPNAQYVYEGLSIASYTPRNSNRLPVYNRLDISATYVPNKKPDNRWKGEWVFGIYNVYNRKNAAAISFGQNLESSVNEATRTAIFGIVPSVTYNFNF
ncbi:TonB-dependent receptor [Lutibacter sp. HS1-25]|uniref:TonB-dependent receptor n=1 Tax=Lutibacter sp. HS1-25 TaxID=2485000 RepID=UPI00101256C1|nr:TonB-dependent receptor [Lutibacter sp. HS1-25]RXP57926.1 TonB-dependent receptor [Lutibacter sp. HS1-25]